MTWRRGSRKGRRRIPTSRRGRASRRRRTTYLPMESRRGSSAEVAGGASRVICSVCMRTCEDELE